MWLKVTDTWSTCPQVIALAALRWVAGGMLVDCLTWAGQNPPLKAGGAVLVPTRVVRMMHMDCPTPLDDIVAALQRVRLLARATVTHATWGPCYRFTVPDDVMHVMSEEEGKANRGTKVPPDMQLRVLARDGDQCRWCGIAVSPADRKSGRARHFDHLDPKGGDTLNNLVVACRTCNEHKADLPRDRNALLAAPAVLHLHKSTRFALEEALLISSTATHGGPGVRATRGGTQQTAAARRDTASTTATRAAAVTDEIRSGSEADWGVISGIPRDGPGQVGTGARVRGGRRQPGRTL